MEVVASAAVEVLAKKLAPDAIQHIGQMLGVWEDLKKLASTMSTIKAVLNDAEGRSTKEEQLRDWLGKLKLAVYDADDLLEEFETEVERRRLDVRHWAAQKVRHFFSDANPVYFRFKMAYKLKKIKERLDEISEERLKYHLNILSDNDRRMQIENRETFPMADENQICGRHDDEEHIVNSILNGDSRENIKITCIVGMGGLGKTTLAQLIYNDERVQKNFEVCIWVYVSADYDLKKIVKKIIEQITGEHCNLESLASLTDKLKNRLSGKKIFMVLDDLWNEDDNDLDKLKLQLNAGRRGSEVLVTTRSSLVGEKTGSSMHHLGCLAEDDCWALFKQKAFAKVGDENSRFVTIGREIVRKCGGVPLAVRTMASILGVKKQEHEWLAVRDSDVWDLTSIEHKVRDSLRLSYDCLSSHLKQCFAYCSIFPKGHEIYRGELVAHWIALGFIPSAAGNLCVQEIGNEYFDNLLGMSFIQFTGFTDPYRGQRYKMHDLLHDLARSIAGKEFCIVEDEAMASRLSQDCRYASFENSNLLLHVSARCVKKMRALLLLDAQNIRSDLSETLSKAKRLRVFDCFNEVKAASLFLLPSKFEWKNLRYFRTVNLDMKTLPETFGSLQNLQTLDLSYCTRLQILPESICCLQNMKTLILSHCEYVVALPDSIGTLQHLRCLDLQYCRSLRTLPQSLLNLTSLQRLCIKKCYNMQELPEGLGVMGRIMHLETLGCHSLEGMPVGIGKLTNLQRLGLFVVSKHADESDNRKYASIAELENMNLIEGLLRIEHFENVQSPMEAGRAKLKEKGNLEELFLSWSSATKPPQSDESNESGEKEMLEGLAPHSNIQHLTIYSYPGKELADWMMEIEASHFPALKKISLCDFKRCELLPPLWRLPSLEELELSGMGSGRSLGADFHGHHIAPTPFPCLKKLHIIRLPQLRAQPYLPLPSSIMELSITYSDEEWLSEESLCLASRLRKLYIGSCECLHDGRGCGTSLPSSN